MDRTQFWKLVAASRRDAGGDLDEQVEALRRRLLKLSPAEIVRFQEIFDRFSTRAYRWDLWGAAYIIGGGCSDDGFIDFRAWLISRGQQAYENALRDPESLVRVVREEDDDCQYEGFQYAASRAWEEKTGKGMNVFPRKGLKSYREKPAGKEWAEEGDDLRRRFPKLWKKFGYE